MSEIKRANGHKPVGLSIALDPAFAAAPRPDPKTLPFDLDAATAAVVSLHSRAPDDAFSSTYLGTEREGNGILIGADGLVLTIGYLISECDQIVLNLLGGTPVPAQVIAYDYETGFGLLRAAGKVASKPLELGSSASVAENDTLVVVARGGRQHAISAKVVSVREFAGYWEYLLDRAIFTMPPHPAWSGAALLDRDGRLAGVGYLYVQDAHTSPGPSPGNMFLPIDAIKPTIDQLLTHGKRLGEPRPWLGLYSAEALGRVLVTSLSQRGPAQKAGIEPGDVIVGVNGEDVRGLADFYRRLWRQGPAGVAVRLKVLRELRTVEIEVKTVNRAELMKSPRAH
jgi:S1-C subfamily serine protease